MFDPTSLIVAGVPLMALVFGLVEFLKSVFSLEGKTVTVSGSGNVAIYAVEKVQQLGGKVVAMSDSNGFIYDPQGIKLDAVKQIKEVERKRIKEYTAIHKSAKYSEGCNGIWNVKCDIALPSATQNELDVEGAKALIKNGCICVAEGANMPTTPDAADLFIENKVAFLPGKAANAGGVAVSGLEMTQNSQRYAWTFEHADAELKNIMTTIYKNINKAAEKYGKKGNFIVGANIAGFVKVADSMLDQGVV